MTRFNRKGGFHISKWKGPKDNVMWTMEVNKPGKFQVSIYYAANSDWAGQPFEITVGKWKIEKRVIFTGDWYEYQKFPVGYFELPEAGEYILKIHPLKHSDNYLMYLRSINLTPVTNIKESGWGSR